MDQTNLSKVDFTLPKIVLPPDFFGPPDKIKQAIQGAGEALKVHAESVLGVEIKQFERLSKSFGEAFKAYIEPVNEIKSIIAETFDYKKFEELRGSFYELAQREKEEEEYLTHQYP